MKKLILFLLLPLGCFSQKQQFVVNYSEPYAVYAFVARISAHYPDNPFKEAFKKSRYNIASYRELLEAYEKIDLHQSFHYDGFPYGQKMPYMVLTTIRHNLIESTTTEQFRMRSLGIIPKTDLALFTEVLTAFLPVYRELVYMPNADAFAAQLKELSRYVAEKDIAAYFDAGQYVYNSSWDASTPFVINIFPTVGTNGFRATAFVNNAVSELPVTFTNYNVLFSVMLHEIYHIVYDEQPMQVKNEIASWFKDNPSPSAQYAYLLLNEAMATAMGNGFVYEQLTGATDKDDWYNSVYINKMAQAIYPMVKQYALQKKPIDKAFVDAYITAYENFTSWPNEAAHVFTYRAIAADDESDPDYFSNNYRHASIHDYEVPLTRAALERIKEKPVTRILIVSRDNSRKLQMITEEFPELKKYRLNPEKEFVQLHFTKEKAWLIIVNRKGSSLEKLMAASLKRGRLPG